jgi:PhnB protein
MTSLNPYLRFSGNCREAMQFYKEAHTGELTMTAIGDSPMAGNMPAAVHTQIMHAALVCDGFSIMGSGLLGEYGTVERGNSHTIMLHYSAEAPMCEAFTKLSQDGRVTRPLEAMFWGAVYGALVDKYGVEWNFNFDKKQQA